MRALGELPPQQQVKILRKQGCIDEAKEIEIALAIGGARALRIGSVAKLLGGQTHMWQNTKHVFGFVPITPPGNKQLDIIHPGNMKANQSLKNKRITVRLDSLRIADYPGKGEHHILFDFLVKNYVGRQSESVRFNQTYRGQEGQSVGIIGYPVFIGLGVGNVGISLECSTINAYNKKDRALIKFLDSDVFKNGLQLTTTLQPAIAPMAGMATNLVKMMAKRNENAPVQTFHMGLDFAGGPGGARLSEGLYFAIQIPDKELAVWDWNEWVYDQRNGRVVKRADSKTLIPYNFISFKMFKYTGD